MLDYASYLGLFAAAFGAATLLPLQSEAILVGMLISQHFSLVALLLVASVGNILGSVVNWYLGRYLERYRTRRWFPVSAAQIERAQRFYSSHGCWTLLLSWVPIIGDPLTLIAGIMREPFWRFVVLVGVAKTARYAAVIATTIGLG